MSSRSSIYQSQSFFPDTQQLIADLGPTPPPLFTQEDQNYKKIKAKAVWNGFPTGSNEQRKTTFVAPLCRPTQKINGTFQTTNNQSDAIPSSPVLKSQRTQTFQPPLRSSQSLFSQQVPSQYNLNKENVPFHDSSGVPQKLSNADIDMLGSFIGQSRGLSHEHGFTHKPPSKAGRKMSISPRRSNEMLIPETPRPNGRLMQTQDSHTKEKYPIGLKHGPSLKTPSRFNLPAHQTPGGTTHSETQLRSVEEIPSKFQPIFDGISYFNIVQSKVFEDVLYTDKPLVVCAPTGSGKTMIFELAITRLLIKQDEAVTTAATAKKIKPKVVYMAPIKALCTERHEDWTNKFSTVGLECQELTGDSDVEDFWQLQKADVILTTPEKWDSMTRRWRDNTSLVRRVQLFLIDEVHLLNDETRGATMEAVVSRMKTIQTSVSSSSSLRFIAVSATIPNTGDIAEWLGTSDCPAVKFDMDESYRPVSLRKVVLGYPWSSNGSEFKFDINLNYKLANVIQTYSENKPTLVFCSTRKSVEQAASTLSRDASFIMDATHKQELTKMANLVRNHRLRELLIGGVGYHHAGLDSHDRHLVEDMFTRGDLLVLFSTSTLAMGVNLPAHLVVVKSTCHYVRGMFQEYTQTEMLQMIGRAGRPQFDTSATAVIMTREQSRNLYRDMVNGCQNIESSLHRHLIEHLNAEVVLTTIGDVTVALEWIRSTFLYIRIFKNPSHYGYPKEVTRSEVDRRLRELCMRNLDLLTSLKLVSIDNDTRLTAQEPGRLMARYCIAFETMKKFSQLLGSETLEEMISMLSECREFQEVTLRMNERSILNKLNKDKNRLTIRFPMNGKIKTSPMKVNCLLQATLGCLSVQEFALQQDITKIFRNAARVCRCLVELLLLKDDFLSIYNGALLSKCVKAKLWENSRHVTKQLPNIGPSLSTMLANAGVCSFDRVESVDPREIEMIVNRHPPFGNHLRDAVRKLPKYRVNMEQGKKYSTDSCDVTIQVVMNNADDLSEVPTAGRKHACLLLIGDADNRVVLKQRLVDSTLLSCDGNSWQRTVTVRRARDGDELNVKLLSLEWVGLDIESTFTPYYLGARRMTATSNGTHSDVIKPISKNTEGKSQDKQWRRCRHNCHNKRLCAHECCKVGIANTGDTKQTPSRKQGNQPQNKHNFTPNVEHLQQYRYNPQDKAGSGMADDVTPSKQLNTNGNGWEMFDSFCEDQQKRIDEDDAGENSCPLAETEFQRQQSYYDDQIDIGGRIAHSNETTEVENCGLKRHPADGRLWTLKGDSQDFGDDDLELIEPRPSKYPRSFKDNSSISQKLSHKLNDQPNSSNDQTPTQLGRVFAWKSSVGQRSQVFKPTVETSNDQIRSNCWGGVSQKTGGFQVLNDGCMVGGDEFVSGNTGATVRPQRRAVKEDFGVRNAFGSKGFVQCDREKDGIRTGSRNTSEGDYMRGNTSCSKISCFNSDVQTSQGQPYQEGRKFVFKRTNFGMNKSQQILTEGNPIGSVNTTFQQGLNTPFSSNNRPVQHSLPARQATVPLKRDAKSDVSPYLNQRNYTAAFEKNLRAPEVNRQANGRNPPVVPLRSRSVCDSGYETVSDTASNNSWVITEMKAGCLSGSGHNVQENSNSPSEHNKYKEFNGIKPKDQNANSFGFRNQSGKLPDKIGEKNFGNTARSTWTKYYEPPLPTKVKRRLGRESDQFVSTPPNILEDKKFCRNANFAGVENKAPFADEGNVSIHCDFDLSDEMDDNLLLEACQVAEGNMEMSQEFDQLVTPNDTNQFKQKDALGRPPASFVEPCIAPLNVSFPTRELDSLTNITPDVQSFSRSSDSICEKNMRAREADELAEAQRMFDNIFGALF